MNKTDALNSVAASLGVPVQWLDALISFESKWNPQAKNPYSSARGLLQFTDKTAQSLGYTDSLDLVTKNKTVESQLFFPVLQYLSKFKPFPSKQSLYMAVFYPVARTWAPSKEFPDTVKSVNPGIRTVSDYLKKVDGNTTSNVFISLSLLALTAILLLRGLK